VRASRKVLQRPRLLGVGLCFEEAEVSGPLAEQVRALCKHLGYYGVFEIEFIEDSGRFLLIDFNPRYYGQMGFDIARGLPLPLLTYQAALGRRETLRTAVDRARDAGTIDGRAYCNRFELAFLLRAQRLACLMNLADASRWKAWLAAHAGKLTDAVVDPRDRKPWLAYVASEMLQYLLHPRSFFKQFKYEP
jgi:predicted ATP-grasp superfamily ATP-dependent carboligase